MGLLTSFGKYLILIRLIFSKPEKGSVFRKQILIEIDNIGIASLGIVTIISVFMGAVVAMQTAANIDSPLMPIWAVGFTTRQSIILEFSPTIVSLILAGKVGSLIASEIGTMRVTEQIDALEIMGINAGSYLILPKIIAAMIIFPILVIISMFLGIFGGWMAVALTGIVTVHNYLYGIQIYFEPYHVTYALIKTVCFAFLITSVSGFHGYFTQGGALEVGKASTKAVVYSSITVILANLILTQLLLD